MFIGILYLFLTFIFCFILVAVIKLAYLGITTLKRPAQTEEKKLPPTKTETVYYIVEKKRASKTNYTEPKEIEFKK